MSWGHCEAAVEGRTRMKQYSPTIIWEEPT
jgi:hypothetical protein